MFSNIGIVGAGNMGSMMAFAFNELGLDVSIWDVNPKNLDGIRQWIDQGQFTGKGKIQAFNEVDQFTQSLGNDQKLFIFSITHGDPADSVLDKIQDSLQKGDIILDGGNEHYRRTEQRQKRCAERGISWIGMGVSGGYQSARHGPSLSPGGDPDAINLVLPLLEKYAAKDTKTKQPCVTNIGPAGSGHFVKMVHNGIEGGMLSTVAEAWSLLHHGLGLQYEEIADIFEQWNSEGELRNNFLLDIGVQILRTKKTPQGDKQGEGASQEGGFVLDDVLDKVVQDDDDTEGTPYWSVMESAARHVSAPTLATAHFLRIASGNRAERLEVARKLDLPKPKPLENIKDKKTCIEKIRRAVYCAFLASFCQGLELIARASNDEGWNVDLSKCLQIWRNGCIIQSEAIADLLQPAMTESLTNVKSVDKVAQELHKHFDALKDTVLASTVADHYTPALSATLEYLKYEAGTMLPTKFMEAQMDLFGAHGYNKPGVKGEDPGPVSKGAHHYDLQPVRIAVIGGTGLRELPGFTQVASLNVNTPWGTPSSPITILHHKCSHNNKTVAIAFLSRHGAHHQIAPHEVPARANIAALRSIGVRTIIAFSAVGSLQEAIKPRDFVIPDQVIDRTKGIRPFTFFEGGVVAHVPFGDPFDEGVTKVVRACGHSLEGEGVVLHDRGTLICMEGPQFSTRAESNMYRSWGGSVINMSCLPEAKLAREAEIAYQMICMSTDYDCWHESTADVTVEMVMGHMKANAENAKRFVTAVLDALASDEHSELVQAKHVEGSIKFGLSTAQPNWSPEARERMNWLFPGYFN
ncbi:6-phosphogluconate dehydrogenase, decarboxylating [Aspergillus saccharolyticus JOP 1030-1]|uniref:S-methyl-5'-thioadenosine phosphorylase n=1 Tax=Aspergillus saccharolyticus JOP 1030-1 TaxID=1450539 RepID=A0A318ZK47_9EURO|nr:6-phosphogluconate dehydrogenase [Aspergillus saccharolyticus JOP 1030-1]PYH44150.1 6-phosphogluconate dehydrogenase [Aspergillus saccharolyticus JOP 1030-1]